MCDATEVSKLTITTPAVCTACSRKYVHLVRGGITTAEELAASGDDLACEPSAKRLFKFMRPDSVGAFRACVTVWLGGWVAGWLCVAVVVWLCRSRCLTVTHLGCAGKGSRSKSERKRKRAAAAVS